MCGVADNLLLGIWDKFLPKVELALNLLCQSNVAPNVSAHSYLTGTHGFNKVLWEPLGCEIIIHDNPGKR